MNAKKVKQQTLIKKQCNIGKYKKFNVVETINTGFSNYDLQNLSFRQTNISHQPISFASSLPTPIQPLYERNHVSCNSFEANTCRNESQSASSCVSRSNLQKRDQAKNNGLSAKNVSIEKKFKPHKGVTLSNSLLQKEKKNSLESSNGRNNLLFQHQNLPTSSSNQLMVPRLLHDKGFYFSSESSFSSPRLMLQDLDDFPDLDLLPRKLENSSNIGSSQNDNKFPNNGETSDIYQQNLEDFKSFESTLLDIQEDVRMGDLDSLPYRDCAKNEPSKSNSHYNVAFSDVSDEIPHLVLSPASYSASDMPKILLPSRDLPNSFNANSKRVQFQLSSSQIDFSNNSSALPSPHQGDFDLAETISNDTDIAITVNEVFDNVEKAALTLNSQKQNSSLPVLLQTYNHPPSNESEHFHIISQSDRQNSEKDLPRTVADAACLLDRVTTIDSVSNNSYTTQEDMYEVPSEEEDILQSSLNRLSFASCHLLPLGTSLKLLRLHRILQTKTDVERGKIMSLYRYFNKWKKNSRLSKILRQQQLMKWRKAKQHYKRQLVTFHLLSWFRFIKVRKALADSFYRRHMLTKGLSALQWMMLQSHERNEMIRRSKQKNTIRHWFYEWKHRFHVSKKKRLRYYFLKWIQMYRCAIIFQIRKVEQENLSLIKYYRTWRTAYQEKSRENLAHSFYCLQLEKKCLQIWIIYSADQDLHRSQNNVALQQFADRTSTKLFCRWKIMTLKSRAAKEQLRKKLLHVCLIEWRRSAHYLKVHHSKQLRLCRSFCHKTQLTRSWKIWNRKLKDAQKFKQKQSEIMRFCFLTWKNKVEKNFFLRNLLSLFVTKLLVSRYFSRWVDYASMKEEKRFEATKIIESLLVQRSFSTWSLAVRHKKFVEGQVKNFHDSQNKLRVLKLFSSWKYAYYRVVAKREAYTRWRSSCALAAARKWREVALQRNRERSADQFIAKFAQRSIADHFSKWKEECCKVIAKARMADVHHCDVIKRRLLVSFREWHKSTAESLLIKPVIEKGERKLCAKVFDAWIGRVTTRHTHLRRADEVKRKKVETSFLKWRKNYKSKKKESVAIDFSEKKMKQKVFGSWIMLMNRRKSHIELRSRAQMRLARRCLRQWRVCAQERHLAVVEIALRRKQEKNVLADCFRQLVDEVNREMALQGEVELYFEKSRRRLLKQDVFKRWKTSLHHRRIAQRCNVTKMKILLATSFRAWRASTEEIIEEDSMLFSAALISRSLSRNTPFCTSTTSLNFMDDKSHDFMSSDHNSRDFVSTDHESRGFMKNNYKPRELTICKFMSGDHKFHNFMGDDCKSRELVLSDHETNCDSELVLIKDQRSESSSLSVAQITLIPDHLTSSPAVGLDGIRHFLSENQDFKSVHTSGTSVSSSTIAGYSSLTDPVSRSFHALSLDVQASRESDSSFSLDDSSNDLQVRQISTARDDDSWISLDGWANFAPRISLNPQHCMSTSNELASRPKVPFDVLYHDQCQSRLESLVYFTLNRLSNPLLSHAFFQWKLLTHVSKWKKLAISNAQGLLKKQKLKAYFVEWKHKWNFRNITWKHWTQKRKLLVMQAWKQLVDDKVALKRKEGIISEKSNFSLVKRLFSRWSAKARKQRTLNDLLSFWLSQSKLRKSEELFETQHDSALFQRCFITWKLKFIQLLKCDQYHRRRQCRRVVMAWSYYTEIKMETRNEVASAHQRLEKRRFLSTWRRLLLKEQKVNQLRRRAVKTHVIALIARWQQRTKAIRNQRNIHEILVEKFHQKWLRDAFVLWQNKLYHQKTANQHRNEKFLRKNFLEWNVFAAKNRRMKIQQEKFEQNRHLGLLSRSFKLWGKVCKLKTNLKSLENERRKVIWKFWCHGVKVRRAKEMGNTALLRRCVASWLDEHRELKKNQKVSWKVIQKWNNFVAKNRSLDAKAVDFVTSQSNKWKLFAFNSWKLVYKQSCRARVFHHNLTSSRFFSAWFLWARVEGEQNKNVAIFLSFQQNMKIANLWQTWRETSLRIMTHNEQLNHFLRCHNNKKVDGYWLLWKQGFFERKASKFHRRRLQAKCLSSWSNIARFKEISKTSTLRLTRKRNEATLKISYSHWVSSLRQKQTAELHRKKSVVIGRFRRWRLWTKKSKTLKQQSQACREWRNVSSLKLYFSNWKSKLQVTEELEFLADEFVCRHQMLTMRKFFVAWSNEIQAHKRRTISLQRKVTKKWKKFARKQMHWKLSRNMRETNLKSKTFITWSQRYKIRLLRHKHDKNVIKTSFRFWQERFLSLSLAKIYFNQTVLLKVWAAWKLRLALLHVDDVIDDENNSDLLSKTFVAWRLVTLKSSEKRPSPHRSRIPRIKRK